MFDIGFPELLIVSIVALLVVGPDRLPGAIRSMSLWVGRFRRSFTNIKQEIEKEIGADEIRAQLYNESIMQDLEKTKETFEDIKNDVSKTINNMGSAASELKSSATATEKNTSEKSSLQESSLQKSSLQKSWAQGSKHEKLETQTTGPKQSSV